MQAHASYKSQVTSYRLVQLASEMFPPLRDGEEAVEDDFLSPNFWRRALPPLDPSES